MNYLTEKAGFTALRRSSNSVIAASFDQQINAKPD